MRVSLSPVRFMVKPLMLLDTKGPLQSARAAAADGLKGSKPAMRSTVASPAPAKRRRWRCGRDMVLLDGLAR